MSVFLNNLDDFIIPSQSCVNPFIASISKEDIKADEDLGTNNKSRKLTLSLQNDFSSTKFELPQPVIEPNLIKSKSGASNQKVATVSLNDCLACRYLI
jgi:hypothetical protein